MRFKLNGFTFSEMMIAVAIIAVLAIATLPRFLDTASTSQSNVTDKVAGQLNTSARLNYYTRTLNAKQGIRITNCKNAANTIQEGLPDGYKIKSKNIAANEIVPCTLDGPDKSTATFYVRGIN